MLLFQYSNQQKYSHKHPQFYEIFPLNMLPDKNKILRRHCQLEILPLQEDQVQQQSKQSAEQYESTNHIISFVNDETIPDQQHHPAYNKNIGYTRKLYCCFR